MVQVRIQDERRGWRCSNTAKIETTKSLGIILFIYQPEMKIIEGTRIQECFERGIRIVRIYLLSLARQH